MLSSLAITPNIPPNSINCLGTLLSLSSPSPSNININNSNSSSSNCSLISFPRKPNGNALKVKVGVGSEFAAQSQNNKEEEEEEEEEEFEVVIAVRSNYNNIVIVDTPKSRLLLLDSTNNVHSILNKQGHKWTASYWDEFASLPAIVPKGPIAILGLGGGTAAHLMLDLCPSLELHGWEIDEILIDKARDYLGLSDLEKRTEANGILHVHIGDAFSPFENVSGKYAGIVVDLFSDGKVLAQLQEVETWLDLNDRLMPNGRLMVNCGGIDGKLIDGTLAQNSTIKALCKAFPGQLSWKRMPKEQGENYLALTGPLPDLTLWSAVVPGHLSEGVKQWKPCEPFP